MVRTKVFVGNLSFKTREAELSQEFSAVAKVVGVNIITRGPRSLGYGFVEMDSEEDAHKAVKAMDKKEIDGRSINVEVAKDRVEGEKKPKAPRAPKVKKEGEAEGEASPAAAGTATTTEGAARGGAKRGGRGGATTTRGARGGARGGAKPRAPKAAPKEGEAETGASPAPRAPRVKKERTPRDDSTRTPSQTVLFVANIPFAFTDETFAKLFTDAGFKLKKAHVVVKKNAKSKGFGFVEFETHEDQQKALAQFEKHKVEDRPLNVKVALEEPPVAEGTVATTTATTAPAASSPAPAAASPKPATPTTPKA